MRDSKIILSSLIIIILLSPAYHFANAQPNTEPPQDSYGLYSNVNPVMAVIMVVLICSFFLVGLFSIFIRHCSESSAVITTTTTTIPTSKQRGLDPATIETFPIFLYSVVKEIKIGRGALECAVCLSEFEDDETLRLLPKCDHVFHPDCIDAWLFSHVTCPVCRANQSSENAKNTPQITSESGTNIESNQVEVNPNEIVITVVDEDGDYQRRARISGKYPRSHSTGHSLVQPGECTERYTLRLPEEIRKQMVLISSSKLKRTMSFNGVLAREEGSSRKGLDRFDRWVFSLTPPFVSKVNCLNGKVEQVEESSA